MSSARRVPETRLLGQGELSADHAWRALRRHGGWRLLRDALVRFRYGMGSATPGRWGCSCAWVRYRC
jgi:hypothetical protein